MLRRQSGGEVLAGGIRAADWIEVSPCIRDWHPSLAIVARLVSDAPAPMALMVGANGAVIANSAMCAIFLERPHQDVFGRPVCDVLPAHAEFLAEMLARARRGESSSLRNQVVRHVTDGKAKRTWLNFDFVPVKDEAGNYLAVICTGSEVSQHLLAQRTKRRTGYFAALAESRLRYETLTETLPQIVWSSGADGRHDYFSKRWSEFTGIPREEITEETWKQLVYPQHWAEVSRAWENAQRTGEPYDIDYRFRHRSGEYRWLRVMALPLRDEFGQITRWCGTSTDVHEAYLMAEERQRLGHELERIATQDQLTEVLTRRAFLQRSAEALDKAANARNAMSVLMMDIDHFKRINDCYGHPSGDAVLSFAAKRMRAATKECDLVGRLGGEEFAILLPDCNAEDAFSTAERVRRAIAEEPFFVGRNSKIKVTMSIGVTTGLVQQCGIEEMLSVADKALYKAKSGGRNRTVFTQFQGG